jgi:hypothetical protein
VRRDGARPLEDFLYPHQRGLPLVPAPCRERSTYWSCRRRTASSVQGRCATSRSPRRPGSRCTSSLAALAKLRVAFPGALPSAPQPRRNEETGEQEEEPGFHSKLMEPLALGGQDGRRLAHQHLEPAGQGRQGRAGLPRPRVAIGALVGWSR